MRYTRYIAAFVALILAASCTISDIDDTPINVVGSNGQLQVVGRVTQFSDCDVATRSKKEGDEPKVTSMGLALFPIENGTIGNCLYYDFKEGGSIVFIVDRHDAVFNNYEGKQFAMYIFANMQDADGFPTTSDAGVGKSLDYFKKCAYEVPADVENVPTSGFPMMGSLGDTTTDDDGKTLILKPAQTDANVDGLPMVDGTPTDNLEIPLKSMYAKFTFTISSKPDQEIVGNKAPRFDLVGYTVHNIPATVDADSLTNNADVTPSSGEYSGGGKYAQGATTATFDFYLPERYLKPTVEDLNEVLPDELKKKDTYDTTVDADQNGYRDEDERYHQRFKNLLPGDAQKATYITIEGKYTDHQGHLYDVSYNIYVGGNNTDNFDVIRNTHYINSIAIRGIDTSSDMANNEDAISIDWRVEVDREATPLVISFRREALLDAHYEVRPMRLRLVGEDQSADTSATVQILNEDGTANNIPSWIRLENSGTDGNTYITSGVSTGKRKYFTTDLVTNTLADKTSVTVYNLSDVNQAVWIYVDENTDTKSRAAIVRVSHGGVNKDYKIVQQGLYSVTVENRTYYIEQYEEYLYNYDAEDSYGQTKDEGMQWGLYNVQLSKEHNSFHIDENNTQWNDYVASTSLLKYDFYVGKHDTFIDATKIEVHNFAGQHFTEEIFENSNGGVKNLTMDQQPSGAVEYCYNRNKRNSDGSISKVIWYLPSADELEDFIVPAYSTFKEFQDNYYWTSQPAYIRSAFYYEYATGSSRGSSVDDAYAFVSYEDNKEYARATKVVYANGEYDYAKSGLNKTPTNTHAMDDNCISKNAELLDDSYFYAMYSWYRWRNGTTTITYTSDEHFDAKKDGSSTGVRYHIHNGHLYDMTQEGYHHRTQQKNRVRCVRADLTTNNQQMVLVYTVSETPATSLDTSGGTMYVMRNTNTNYSAYYLTTSGNDVAASNSAVSEYNYVVIDGNMIKSVAKNQYFSGYNGDVSFSDNSGTSYSFTDNGDNFRISYRSGSTYYLKQTGNTTVQMNSGNSGNRNWYFYEVKQEYKVVE